MMVFVDAKRIQVQLIYVIMRRERERSLGRFVTAGIFAANALICAMAGQTDTRSAEEGEEKARALLVSACADDGGALG